MERGEPCVGGGEFEILQGVGFEPADLCVLDGCGISGYFNLDEADQEGIRRIPVLEQHATHRDGFQPQFLGQFTLYRLVVGLPLVDLSSWELPQTTIALVRGSAPQENPGPPSNHRRHDWDLVHRRRVTVPLRIREGGLRGGVGLMSAGDPAFPLFFRVADRQVLVIAHEWHLQDERLVDRDLEPAVGTVVGGLQAEGLEALGVAVD